MPTNLPGAADSFSEIPSGTKQGTAIGSRTHRQHHNDLGDAVEQLTAMVGTGATNATPTAGKVRRATGTGTAEWGAVQTGDMAANAVSDASEASVGGFPTTTSTTPADIAGASVTRTITAGSLVLVHASLRVSNNTVNGFTLGYAHFNGAAQEIGVHTSSTAGAFGSMGRTFLVTGLSGSQTFKVQWAVGSGSTQGTLGNARITVLELKR